jgi:hypothetical protein
MQSVSSFWSVIMGVEVFAFACAMFWFFMAFVTAPRREAYWKAKLRSLLTPGEEAIVKTMQCRSFAVFSRRNLYAVTAQRAIKIQRHFFGGFHMTDIPWKDLKDAQVSENVLPIFNGASLILKTNNTLMPVLHMEGVPTPAAMAMYSKAQGEEQVWDEKRHTRYLEEQKAKAGGIILSNVEMQ